MENNYTTMSILNDNAIACLIARYNLVKGPAKNMHSLYIDKGSGRFVHIAVFNERSEKMNGTYGINEYMPSIRLFFSASKDAKTMERKRFDIFEYDDIKRVCNEVDNLIAI